MREDIELDAEGVTLRGWFYPAEGARGEAPCVVMQHGFAATIEMRLAAYAEVFAAAGISVLVYDHPGFGISDHDPRKPRQELDPWEQVRGIQHAITHAQSRSDVDASRIGVWGSSYGAANAYTVASIDRRVGCVVGQVPLISGRRTFQSLVRIDFWQQTWDMLAADRAGRAAGQDPIMLPVVDEDPLAQSALPTADSYAFFSRYFDSPSFTNQVTLRTLEHLYGYEPGENVKRISPTPLLMIVAPHDRLAAGEWATAAFETAAQPKKLVLIPGGHFDAYEGEGFAIGSAAARDWFVEHLLARRPVVA